VWLSRLGWKKRGREEKSPASAHKEKKFERDGGREAGGSGKTARSSRLQRGVDKGRRFHRNPRKGGKYKGGRWWTMQGGEQRGQQGGKNKGSIFIVHIQGRGSASHLTKKKNKQVHEMKSSEELRKDLRNQFVGG